MIVDKGFVKQLKNLDKDLDVNWDSVKERFQIIRNGRVVKRVGTIDGENFMRIENKAHHILTVENEDESFRKLDYRVIDQLKESDTQRYDSLNALVGEMEQYEDNFKLQRDKRNSYAVQELTKENFHRIQDGIEELRSMR